jgi:hypothetical protein
MIRTNWRVIFGAFGFHDSDIGHCGGIVNRTAKPLLDSAIAVARTHRQPFGKDLLRRRNRNRRPAYHPNTAYEYGGAPIPHRN